MMMGSMIDVEKYGYFKTFFLIETSKIMLLNDSHVDKTLLNYVETIK